MLTPVQENFMNASLPRSIVFSSFLSFWASCAMENQAEEIKQRYEIVALSSRKELTPEQIQAALKMLDQLNLSQEQLATMLNEGHRLPSFYGWIRSER